ncbi:hypothetical protein T484DRAFT_1855320, partial [Baffinella frigidus]
WVTRASTSLSCDPLLIGPPSPPRAPSLPRSAPLPLSTARPASELYTAHGEVPEAGLSAKVAHPSKGEEEEGVSYATLSSARGGMTEDARGRLLTGEEERGDAGGRGGEVHLTGQDAVSRQDAASRASPLELDGAGASSRGPAAGVGSGPASGHEVGPAEREGGDLEKLAASTTNPREPHEVAAAVQRLRGSASGGDTVQDHESLFSDVVTPTLLGEVATASGAVVEAAHAGASLADGPASGSPAVFSWTSPVVRRSSPEALEGGRGMY